MINYGHFIGGKHVAGTSGRYADVFQPMDGTVRGKVALASKAELDAAIANAKAAQPAVTDQRERPVVEAGLEGLGDEARHLDRHP